MSRLVFEIKHGNRSDDVALRMQQTANALVGRGAEVIVAACTEIPLVLTPDMLPVPLVSSTDVLAEVTAARCAGVA
jgi:aspartate racemase